ncbi:MAG: Mur ligase domain-containing protein [Candidatus Paceibacterota bacterium]
MKIYFIGIGGIGVSALARYYLRKGHKIHGSDTSETDLIQSLKKEGMTININQNGLKQDFDLVVYSPAIKENNKDYIDAKKRKLNLLSYPEALGKLSKEKFTIAISGTHGKSTTTAMLSLILIEAKLDPTVIIGTTLKEFDNTNVRIGNSKYLVLEACEYENSFLNYHPDIGVILNIEKDHLDYFKNFENIKKSFNEFAKQSKKVILEKQIEKLIKSNNKIVFDKNKTIKPKLGVGGEFNILNAMHALETARTLKIKDEISLKALSKFKGTWRRMDIDDHSFDFTIINDYAHHPTEIKATLKAIREENKNKKIYCIFEPHQYDRTFRLFNDFKKVFQESLLKDYVDKLLIFPIYTVKGREKQKKTSSQELVSETNHKNCSFLQDFDTAKLFIEKNLKKGDLLIIMGAGSIYNLYKYLLEFLNK